MSSANIEKLQLMSSKATDYEANETCLPKNLLCFSHLRWDFVYQRPQHLMSRFGNIAVVYFFEEPIFTNTESAYLHVSQRDHNIWVCVPHIPHGLDHSKTNTVISEILEFFFSGREASEFIFWYYTPMALQFSEHLNAAVTVYDCMDELAAFRFAPDELQDLEQRLLSRADIVFTGGRSLYEAKKTLHENIYPFPSSIDKKHFAKARDCQSEPADQKAIHGPKIGFYGVIDERFDISLVAAIADLRPDWNIVLIGPVVKIDPAMLPKRSNIFYLGAKSYEQLPLYLSGWDVAMVPFVIDESTRFVSPTKTPEYLCAGRPVVSTPIADILDPYGKNELVSIGSDGEEFVEAVAWWLKDENRSQWLEKTDKFLLTMSWDITFSDMTSLISQALKNKNPIGKSFADETYLLTDQRA